MVDQRAWWSPHSGHWIDPLGHLAGTGVGYMVDHWRRISPEHVITKTIEKYGGPGNRTQVPAFTKCTSNHLSYARVLYVEWTKNIIYENKGIMLIMEKVKEMPEPGLELVPFGEIH